MLHFMFYLKAQQSETKFNKSTDAGFMQYFRFQINYIVWRVTKLSLPIHIAMPESNS